VATSSRREVFDNLGTKALVLCLVILTAMALLVARLVWLQILQNKYYKGRSVENSTRVIFLRAPRGIIYDRHGNLLATNKQSLSMTVIPRQIEEVDDLAERLARVLDTSQTRAYRHQTLDTDAFGNQVEDRPVSSVDEIRLRLLRAKESDSVMPVVIERDVDLATVGRFYEQKMWLPGVDILPDISRNYPHGELTAHILGYTGEIPQDWLERTPERRMGDIVGKDGVERIFDTQIRGIDGEQRVRVNASGHSLSAETSQPVVTKEPKAGQPLVLSIDVDLQKAAYEALGDRKGAVVACDPQTGEVLALVSRPSFDPNVFTKKITPAIWKRLNAPDHPLYNRALSGFPPGSIWKALTLLAALDSKAVKPDTRLHVSGGISLGGFFFGDWTGKSGIMDLVQCLAWSRDSAFYQMALKMKPEQIKLWANKFGAGRPTGIELPHEKKGLVPDSEWKEKNLHEKWYPGNTLHMSIGQTFLEVTPVQGARIYAGLGMKGQVPNLHLAMKIADRQIPVPAKEKVTVKPEYMEVVSKGLKAVVAGGTGGATRLANIEVAGKTGSAEAPPAGSKTHAWFCCYAPADKPRIAICAFVEHGGHGGSTAAPIAKVVLEKFFSVAPPEMKTATAKPAVPAKPRRKRH
jgi:penicillin-binding protein 2